MSVILVVDDVPLCRELLAATLQAHGFTARTAASAREAQASIEAMLPDLMLLDVDMPEVDGLTFLESLRRYPQWRHIPVILFTDSGDVRHVRGAKDLGASDYVLKSGFSTESLLARIRKWLPADARVA